MVQQSDDDNYATDGSVTAVLSDGHTQKYDLIAIADGQASRLRDRYFPSSAVTKRDIGMYVSYWTLPRKDGDDDYWQIHHGLQRRVLHLRPDPYGTMRAGIIKMPLPGTVADDERKRAWRAGKGDQIALLRRDYADAGWQAPRRLDSIDAAPDFHFGHVQQIRMKMWSMGRVVCVGDAAYAPTPITGMGTSLALLGAYTLAGEISLRSTVIDGKRQPPVDPRQALDAYERILRPFVQETQDFPTWLPSLMHPTTSLQRWILHRMFTLMSRIVAIPWVARWAGDIKDEDLKLPHYPLLASSATSFPTGKKTA